MHLVEPALHSPSLLPSLPCSPLFPLLPRCTSSSQPYTVPPSSPPSPVPLSSPLLPRCTSSSQPYTAPPSSPPSPVPLSPLSSLDAPRGASPTQPLPPPLPPLFPSLPLSSLDAPRRASPKQSRPQQTTSCLHRSRCLLRRLRRPHEAQVTFHLPTSHCLTVADMSVLYRPAIVNAFVDTRFIYSLFILHNASSPILIS